ncbi:hypothetical protein M231_07775 [Tremella mesenterica]|uniref:Uncharacterized protein n=1 Tax=Tremella mesenterica TaxID=5217 RepID=A0A4Q1BFD7_TREME|nr:hypothetical protein M231_07775 [Tremella mesenterica]
MPRPTTQRQPLGLISPNTLSPTHQRDASKSTPTRQRYTSLGKIHNRGIPSSPRSPTKDAIISSSSVKVDLITPPRIPPAVHGHDPSGEIIRNDDDKLGEMGMGMGDWFPSLIRRSTKSSKSLLNLEKDTREVVESGNSKVWVRRRKRRSACRMQDTLMSLSTELPTTRHPSYLATLATSLAPYNPDISPSLILLPSHHSPTGHARDFSPALGVAFNSIAKSYDSSMARAHGRRRLLAVAGEEGGVRVVDVDQGLGPHRESRGLWWRAHANAIFDISWSPDDTSIMTTSGDQTTRLHSVEGPEPRLLATLRGHTSSIKTAVFFDPSRSHVNDTNIIASGGRDGNILIYDLRCRGRIGSEQHRRRTKARYSLGVPGFSVQDGMNLDPVMIVQAAHGEAGKRGISGRTATRSVTSLVALQAMPGVLASGGSFDGIVKLWDLRFTPDIKNDSNSSSSCTPLGILPDPTLIPGRRSRSINSLVESPTTGDLYALCGDSQIHTLRPSAYSQEGDSIAILPQKYSDPSLLVSSFYVKMAVSSDGKYLASGSCQRGLMTWQVNPKGCERATRFGDGKKKEVCAVDWGHELLAGTTEDSETRIWRPRWAVEGGDLIGPIE